MVEISFISTNLPNFSYPDIWGIDEWYSGFPHPYGFVENEQVMAYSSKKQKEEADKLIKNADKEEVVLRQRYTDMLACMSLGGYWPEDEGKENFCSYLQQYSGEVENYFEIMDIDKDGQEELLVKSPYDGIIVYSYDLEKSKAERKETAENAEEWEKGKGESAKIQWKALRSENYSIYTQAYISYYLKQLEKDMGSDIGCVYMGMPEGNSEQVMNSLKDKYAIDFAGIDGEGFAFKGSCEGKESFTFYVEDGHMLKYENERVNGITLLGVYPGMDEKEADKLLNKYGFYKRDEYSYQTGGSIGNYFVNCRTENGKVISISIWAGNLYMG